MKGYMNKSLVMLASAGLLLGATHALAATPYTVTYSQTFGGTFFGSPTTTVVSGTFAAIDLNSDGRLTTLGGEIDTASFSFIATGNPGNYNFSGAQIDAITIDWLIGDTNMTDALSSANVSALPATGAGLNWITGAAQFYPSPQGALYLFFDQVPSSFGFFPGNATNAPTFTATVVPEPGTYLMMLAGIAGVAAYVRRRAA